MALVRTNICISDILACPDATRLRREPVQVLYEKSYDPPFLQNMLPVHGDELSFYTLQLGKCPWYGRHIDDFSEIRESYFSTTLVRMVFQPLHNTVHNVRGAFV